MNLHPAATRLFNDRFKSNALESAARLHSIVLLFVFPLAGCGTMHLPCSNGEEFTAHELIYFGTETPSGRVSPEDWSQFLEKTITQRFPEGLTVWQATGQWRDASGSVIQEPSYIMSLVHPDTPTAETAIQAVIESYKARFQQEAVLRVKSYACGSF